MHKTEEGDQDHGMTGDEERFQEIRRRRGGFTRGSSGLTGRGATAETMTHSSGATRNLATQAEGGIGCVTHVTKGHQGSPGVGG